MDPVDPDLFNDPSLGFSIRKPPEWTFYPPSWSPIERLRNSDNPSRTLMKHAHRPFCCAMYQHSSDRHAYPTLQVTVRPVHLGSADVYELMDAEVAHLVKTFPNIRILQNTCNLVLSGCRVIRIEARYSLYMSRNDDEIELGVYSLSHTVFASGRAFVVGLSGSDDPEYTNRAELAEIAASIVVEG